MKITHIILGGTLVFAITACASTNSTNVEKTANKTATSTQSELVQKTASNTSNAAIENGDKIVCKKKNVTSSRLAKAKVCRTKAEWAELRKKAKNHMNRVQRQNSGSGQGSN